MDEGPLVCAEADLRGVEAGGDPFCLSWRHAGHIPAWSLLFCLSTGAMCPTHLPGICSTFTTFMGFLPGKMLMSSDDKQ